MRLIFKICPLKVWQVAEKEGYFAGATIDLEDGYIHFSAGDQVRETANKYFRGQKDLLLIAVDAQALGEKLRWEPSRGGALFPHLYDRLELSSVVWTKDLPLQEDGTFAFPEMAA